jgi:hypothetical protein
VIQLTSISATLQPEADPRKCHLKVYVHPELLELPEWEALRADLGPKNFNTIGEQGPLSSDRIAPGAIGTGLHGFMSDGALGDKRHYKRQSVLGPKQQRTSKLGYRIGHHGAGQICRMMLGSETSTRICTASATRLGLGEGAGRCTCI